MRIGLICWWLFGLALIFSGCARAHEQFENNGQSTLKFISLLPANEANDGIINSAESQSAAAIFLLDAVNYSTAEYTSPLDESTVPICDESQTYQSTTVPTINQLPADGNFSVCVKLSDVDGNVVYGKSSVVWRDTVAPAVNAGPDLSTDVTITLDATVTGAEKTTWSQVSGPSSITFSSPNSEDTAVTALLPGKYLLRLTATDHAGNSAYDEMIFTWLESDTIFTSLNAANEAADGYINNAEKISTLPAYTLTATSYNAVAYTEFLTSSAVCDAQQSYTLNKIPAIYTLPNLDGAYIICVRFTDMDGEITYEKSQVIIRDTVAPTVAVGADVTTSSLYSLNATVTNALTYAWTKVSGPGTITFGSSNTEDTTVVADAFGSYVLRLTATDAAGNFAYDELTFVWQDAPLAVDVGADESREELFTKTATYAGAVKFQWSVTSANSADIIFGSATASSTTILAMNAGVYTIRLTVTNTSNATAYDEFTLSWGKKDHLLFVTSSTFTGNSISSGSAICQNLATAQGLPGTYLALLSTYSISAISLVTISGYVRNSLGQIIARTHADFWDGELENNIRYTEKGTTPLSRYFWSGSNNSGNSSTNNCGNWSDSLQNSTAGSIYSINSWLSTVVLGCSSMVGFLCLSNTPAVPFTQLEAFTGNSANIINIKYRLPANISNLHHIDLRRASGTAALLDCGAGTLAYSWNSGFAANGTLTYTDTAEAEGALYSYRVCLYNDASTLIASYPGRAATYSGTTVTHKAFVTSTKYTGNLGGVTGADANCQAQAAAASLTGTYKAIISDSVTAANKHITILGNVRRVDGVLLAGNSADFWDGEINVPLNRTEANVEIDTNVMSNSTASGEINASNGSCLNWTTMAAGNNHYVGGTQYPNASWITNNSSNPCSYLNALYCISQ